MGITAEIYNRLDKMQALASLAPQDKGNALLLACPACGKREAYIYKNGSTIKCNRANKCGYSASIFEYIQQKEGYEAKETVRKLAEMADCPLDLKNFDENRYNEKITRESILEHALTFFQKSLAESKAGMQYLNGRKYSESDVDAMGLGFFTSFNALNDYLVNIVNKINNVSNDYLVNIVNTFNDSRLQNRIVIPYRDYLGRLQGFSFRTINKAEPKYLNSAGLKTAEQFFNFDKNRGEKTLIITEGYLDALITSVKGLKGVAATGKAYISDAQLENAIKHGVKHFILALDQDNAGMEGTRKALGKINEKGAKGYALTLPSSYKDIDEYLRKHSIEELEQIVQKAWSGSRYMAESLLSKHSKQLTDIERRKVIDEALEYEESLADVLDSKDFIETVAQGLDIIPQQLQALTKDYRDKKAKERQKKSYKELQFKASQLLNAGKLAELHNIYKEELPSIAAEGVNRIIEPYSLESFTYDVQSKKVGLKTGFNEIDKKITIPQEAITIIAGRPSHGKTTFLLNLFLNFVKMYEEKRFFFFSYEETKSQLALKCINILSGEQLDQYKNLEFLETYIKQGRTNRPPVEKGKKAYQKFVQDGRLWLIEESYYVDDLVDTILYLADKYDNLGAIFIDYIQKIKIKGRYQNRQVEIQKISQAILEAAKKAHLPIILGAQLNREVKDDKVSLANLRESGDIEQDANLVLGIYNKAMQEAEDANKALEDKEISLDIKILKNRGGITGKSFELEFIRPILTLQDK